jgi:hypothetical protein
LLTILVVYMIALCSSLEIRTFCLLHFLFVQLNCSSALLYEHLGF